MTETKFYSPFILRNSGYDFEEDLEEDHETGSGDMLEEDEINEDDDDWDEPE